MKYRGRTFARVYRKTPGEWMADLIHWSSGNVLTVTGFMSAQEAWSWLQKPIARCLIAGHAMTFDGSEMRCDACRDHWSGLGMV